MGKPTNSKPAPCAVAASDCITWTGPNFCFITVCDKASITDVITALGTETCLHSGYLNVAEYDIACLIDGLEGCPPGNFRELFQLVIEKVCLNGCTTPSSPTLESSCGECEIGIASCFQTETTVMSLYDYVSAIGIKVCEQQVTIQTQQNAILSLLNRVTMLEEQIQILIGG
jgi:hypothetical protein